jgi:hypothetical protein
MRLRLGVLFLAAASFAFPVIIDRIAIVVNSQMIKQSDINRDLRVTDFLNHEPLSFSPTAEKKAATRLIDQAFIRHEVRVGDYPTATFEDADAQLSLIKKDKFKSDEAFLQDLKHYGLTVPDLRFTFRWQLTVLRFIDVRFKPAALVTDADVQQYYKAHLPALRKAHPKGYSLQDLTSEIHETLVSEKVNQLFFAWLDEQRKDAKIQYLEEQLR